MAKKVNKQRKKRNFAKVRKAILNTSKLCGRIFIAILGIASLMACIVIPFLHNSINHKLAQLIWYPALIILALISIVGNIRRKHPFYKTQLIEFLGKWGEFTAYPIVVSIFIFNYYDIDYIWMWVIFGMVLLFVPVFFLSIFNFYIKNDHPTDNEKQKASINIVKLMLLYWFIDFFYMSIFNDWLIPTFVFGILSIVIVFFNLIDAFLNSSKRLLFFIVLEMIIALITSGYLIFIIPNESLQEIVLAITAALFGGILTLVGVAWTIKQAHEDDFNKDVQRNTPYLRKVGGPVDSSLMIEVFPNGNYYLGVELISDSIFVFIGALINNKMYSQKRLVAPNTSFTVVLNVQDYEEIALIGSDKFGNLYRFDLDIYIKQSSNTKIIDSIGLPIGISNEDIFCSENNANI